MSGRVKIATVIALFIEAAEAANEVCSGDTAEGSKAEGPCNSQCDLTVNGYTNSRQWCYTTLDRALYTNEWCWCQAQIERYPEPEPEPESLTIQANIESEPEPAAVIEATYTTTDAVTVLSTSSTSAEATYTTTDAVTVLSTSSTAAEACDDDESSSAWLSTYSCDQLQSYGWCEPNSNFYQNTVVRCCTTCKATTTIIDAVTVLLTSSTTTEAFDNCGHCFDISSAAFIQNSKGGCIVNPVAISQCIMNGYICSASYFTYVKCGVRQAASQGTLQEVGDGAYTNLQVCQGDCDGDDSCAGTLKCFQRDTGDPMPYCDGIPLDPGGGSYDYCYEATTTTTDAVTVLSTSSTAAEATTTTTDAVTVLSTSSTTAEADARWTKGAAGQTCHQVCQALGKRCNSAQPSTLTTNDLVRDAFAAAGYTCKGFHAARSYDGAPFSTGRADDCAPISNGAASSCTGNHNGNHSPLCYCEADRCAQYGGMSHPEGKKCCAISCGDFCGAGTCSDGPGGEAACCGSVIPDHDFCDAGQLAPCTMWQAYAMIASDSYCNGTWDIQRKELAGTASLQVCASHIQGDTACSSTFYFVPDLSQCLCVLIGQQCEYTTFAGGQVYRFYQTQAGTGLVINGFCEFKNYCNGEFALLGNTASGAPYYKKLGEAIYIYYDPSCDGVVSGNARWICDNSIPDILRESDLDDDSSCSYHARINSDYSAEPPLGENTWRVYCNSWTDVLVSIDHTEAATTTTDVMTLLSTSSTTAEANTTTTDAVAVPSTSSTTAQANCQQYESSIALSIGDTIRVNAEWLVNGAIINLLDNMGNILVHWSARENENTVVRNSFFGSWGPEERDGGWPFLSNADVLELRLRIDEVETLVNGQHWSELDFKYRTSARPVLVQDPSALSVSICKATTTTTDAVTVLSTSSAAAQATTTTTDGVTVLSTSSIATEATTTTTDGVTVLSTSSIATEATTTTTDGVTVLSTSSIATEATTTTTDGVTVLSTSSIATEATTTTTDGVTVRSTSSTATEATTRTTDGVTVRSTLSTATEATTTTTDAVTVLSTSSTAAEATTTTTDAVTVLSTSSTAAEATTTKTDVVTVPPTSSTTAQALVDSTVTTSEVDTSTTTKRQDAQTTPVSGQLIFDIGFFVEKAQIEQAAKVSLSIHFEIDEDTITVVASLRQSRRLWQVVNHLRRLSKTKPWLIEYGMDMSAEKLAAATVKVQDPDHEIALVNSMKQHFIVNGVPESVANISLVGFTLNAAPHVIPTATTTTTIGTSSTTAAVENSTTSEGDAKSGGGGSTVDESTTQESATTGESAEGLAVGIIIVAISSAILVVGACCSLAFCYHRHATIQHLKALTRSGKSRKRLSDLIYQQLGAGREITCPGYEQVKSIMEVALEGKGDSDDMVYFFVSRDEMLKMDANKPMPSFYELSRRGKLTAHHITLEGADRGKYRDTFAVVSHRWRAPHHPDEDSGQLKAIQQQIMLCSTILWVWIDWMCMPQNIHRPKIYRTPLEKHYFAAALKNINVMYLFMDCFILLDLQYSNRFWCLLEAYLGTHHLTRDGLVATDVKRKSRKPRHHFIKMYTANEHHVRGLTEVLGKTEEEMLTALEQDDICVTNQNDKLTMIPKMRRWLLAQRDLSSHNLETKSLKSRRADDMPASMLQETSDALVVILGEDGESDHVMDSGLHRAVTIMSREEDIEDSDLHPPGVRVVPLIGDAVQTETSQAEAFPRRATTKDIEATMRSLSNSREQEEVGFLANPDAALRSEATGYEELEVRVLLDL